MKTNQNALQPFYLKSTFMFAFLKWKYYIFIFHIITEELGQHVWLDLAFASQKLKFARQMSDDGR